MVKSEKMWPSKRCEVVYGRRTKAVVSLVRERKLNHTQKRERYEGAWVRKRGEGNASETAL